jgi:hypothetical protein
MHSHKIHAPRFSHVFFNYLKRDAQTSLNTENEVKSHCLRFWFLCTSTSEQP